MRSPFRGMDPYLDCSDLCSQVHNRLIIAIADALTPQIAPRYRASIEERIYMADEPARQHCYLMRFTGGQGLIWRAITALYRHLS